MPLKGNKKVDALPYIQENDNWMKLYFLFKFSFSRFSVSINVVEFSFTGKTSRGSNSSSKDNKPKTSSLKTNRAAELRRKANEAKLSKF